MNNFAAEVPNFFLKDRSLTTIVSEPGPYYFSKKEVNKPHKMRVVLKNKSTLMYDNQSAFGPPVDSSNGTNDSSLKGYSFAPYVPAVVGQNEESAVVITFTPTKKSHTIDEIISGSTTTFSYGRNPDAILGTSANNAMSITASLNLFGIVKEPLVTRNSAGDIISISDRPEDTSKRWTIQTKWETPVLDFSSADMTLYNGSNGAVTNLSAVNSDLSTPAPWMFAGSTATYLTSSRGMWHQYGQIPEKTKGYKIEVQSVHGSPSLAQKAGFISADYTVGQIAEVKEIGECVVAVPYYVENSTVRFFDLEVEDVREALGELVSSRNETGTREQIPDSPGVAATVRHQISMMQKYIFPPQLDFVKYRDKSPIAMYVFEFTHRLDQQDLADIWQNLPPKIGVHAEGFVESYASHRLLKGDEGFGYKGPLSGEMAEKLQWMVFKVKKKAANDYFKKQGDSVFKNKPTKVDVAAHNRAAATVASSLRERLAKTDGYSYNWPYDYFSLVELIKMDAQVLFKD
jgi:hypothetical protein